MGWLGVKVAARHEWAPGLVSLRLDTRVAHEAGQFVSLALDDGEQRVKRSYSAANAEGAEVEVYVSQVDGGQLSPRLLSLAVGDRVWLEDQARGFFTLKWVPGAKVAWMLSTGTGLSPFLSMLRGNALEQHFGRVVLVHGVRRNAHLGYREELSRLAASRPGFLTYVPMVTREPPSAGGLRGRIPERIVDGSLERCAASSLSEEGGHVLLCGNPSMISEAREALEQRGLRIHRRRQPGHISFERYW